MSNYSIGDVQGCFKQLIDLLHKIKFDPHHDRLWFTGDLVNRGPESLAVLRFVKHLGDKAIVVLGNHDLHLLAVANQQVPIGKHDTFAEILAAKDCAELCTWLRQQPLLHHDAHLGYTMVHAGLAPQWNLAKAKQCASEVEEVLQSDRYLELLQHLYGNEPNRWDDHLTGFERLRLIINYFTRMRFCKVDGTLDLATKGSVTAPPQDFFPWFNITNRKNKDLKIIFGHWAALNGETHVPNVFAIDTGCVWGNCLTAMRLKDGERFTVACA